MAVTIMQSLAEAQLGLADDFHSWSSSFLGFMAEENCTSITTRQETLQGVKKGPIQRGAY